MQEPHLGGSSGPNGSEAGASWAVLPRRSLEPIQTHTLGSHGSPWEPPECRPVRLRMHSHGEPWEQGKLRYAVGRTAQQRCPPNATGQPLSDGATAQSDLRSDCHMPVGTACYPGFGSGILLRLTRHRGCPREISADHVVLGSNAATDNLWVSWTTMVSWTTIHQASSGRFKYSSIENNGLHFDSSLSNSQAFSNVPLSPSKRARKTAISARINGFPHSTLPSEGFSPSSSYKSVVLLGSNLNLSRSMLIIETTIEPSTRTPS